MKGFVPDEAVKLKVLDDGGTNDDCCTPLAVFAPKAGVKVLIPAKKLGVEVGAE